MKIIYEETFVSRLEKQLKHITKDNPSAAKKFKKEILSRIKEIPKYPEIYRKSIYSNDSSVKDLIYKGYTVVFKIEPSQINVFGFLKHQENPTD